MPTTLGLHECGHLVMVLMRADLIPVLLRRPRVREATWPARKTLLERKLHAGGDFSLFY